MDTYKFAPPTDVSGHIKYDVLPYYLLGNDPNDPTSGSMKFCVALKGYSLESAREIINLYLIIL